jgi:hypothetical protein
MKGGRWNTETVTADRLLFSGPGEWGGYVLLTSADEGDVTVYDGLDVQSGKQLAVLQAGDSAPLPYTFIEPIPVDRGLYVDVGDNVTSIMMVYRTGK